MNELKNADGSTTIGCIEDVIPAKEKPKAEPKPKRQPKDTKASK